MSKYTTEVRWICEYEAEQANAGRIEGGFNNIDTILNLSAPRIFNFDFPIFDENYRLSLEKKILRHFYTREICEETVGLWKLRLDDKLNMIMPYYNQLYRSETLEFNPLYDVDISRDHSGSASGTTNSVENSGYQNRGNENKNRNDVSSGNRGSVSDTNNSSNSNTSNSENNSITNQGSHSENEGNTNWNLFSDTPQGGVQLMDNDDPETVAGNAYLTNATKNTNNGNKSGSNNDSTNEIRNNEGIANRNDVGHSDVNETINNENNTNEVNQTSNSGEEFKNYDSNINNIDQYIEHVKGKQGSRTYSSMLIEYRKTMLNIDSMIIDELNDLFFGLW